MRVLVVNAGSSSLKLDVIGAAGDAAEDALELDDWDGGGDAAAAALVEVVARAGGFDAVGHRIVHGGHDLTGATLVDEAVRARVLELSPLAPLHQPRAVTALDAARRVASGVPHVACFDTAFHATLPPAARTYALPREWRQRWGLDRHGFHGLSHAWAARRAPEIAGRAGGGRIVSCHLGAGASLCAVRDGLSVDTTMGFTPLEGLVMATRAGSVDPGLVLWLVTDAGLAPAEVADGLATRGGLAGLSGTDGDMRAVLAARARGDADAVLAFEVHAHRLRREIAAMTAALGGIDVLAFTGGVGEGSALVRDAAVARLGHLGLALDAAANAAATGDADIGAAGAAAGTVVITSREELEIARQVRNLLGVRDVPPSPGA